MSDIFEGWKNGNFILAPRYLTEDNAILIIMTNLQFWIEHAEELELWCSERNASVSGMTVVLGSEELLTEFYLKWS